MRLGTWMGIGFCVVVGVGCGGGGSQAPESYSAIAAGFAHPTGTLAATNADAVAQAYQASLGSGLNAAGRRLDQVRDQTTTVTQPCPNGGTVSVNASQASSSSISETFNYNQCCETAGCCFNGGGSLYYSGAGTTTGSFCESFQVTATCSGAPVTENFSLCEDGTNGMISYLVEVDGQSFTVSGNYSNGNGTLTITGANGRFTCTYTNNTGSCTGSSGSFSF